MHAIACSCQGQVVLHWSLLIKRAWSQSPTQDLDDGLDMHTEEPFQFREKSGEKRLVLLC